LFRYEYPVIGRMSNEERIRLVQSRIHRAQAALDRAADLVDVRSHALEPVENALVEAIAETTGAEKLMRPHRVEFDTALEPNDCWAFRPILPR
jgi:hypothetical protein